MSFHLFLAAKVQQVIETGDLEFLKTKADAGTLVYATGNRTTTGVICSYTPASGKTFYFVKGTIMPSDQDVNSDAIVQIRNDATVREHLTISIVARQNSASGTGGGGICKHYSTIFDKLIGNGSKVYDLNASQITASQPIYGSLFGWIEDT